MEVGELGYTNCAESDSSNTRSGIVDASWPVGELGQKNRRAFRTLESDGGALQIEQRGVVGRTVWSCTKLNSLCEDCKTGTSAAEAAVIEFSMTLWRVDRYGGAQRDRAEGLAPL